MPAAHGAGASPPAPAEGHSQLMGAAIQQGARVADPLTSPRPSLDVGEGWATLSLCHLPQSCVTLQSWGVPALFPGRV